MNIQEIYELGIAQGWSEADAYQMALIAWAESKGVPDEVYNEPSDDSTSYGIWQINSIHLPKLIEAGIILSAADLADPIVNATAAYYVGHHQDKTVGSTLHETYKDKFDWTRWGTMGLLSSDQNHPSQFESLLPAPEGTVIDWGPPTTLPRQGEAAVGGDIDYRQILKDWFPGLTDLSPEEFEPIYQNALTIIERLAGQEEGFTGLDYLQNLQSSGLSWSGDAVADLFTNKIAEINEIQEEDTDVGEGTVPVDEADPTEEEDGDPAWDEVEVPWDFQSQVETEEIRQQFTDWGFTPAQQIMAWQYLWKEYSEYADGTADKNIGNWLREGGDAAALTEVQELLTYLGEGGAVIGPGSDYTPGRGSLPTGWLSFWGEDNSVVGDWLDMWLERFNANAGMDVPYSTDDLEEDFFNAEDGLYQQGWWNNKTDNWLKMAELWYTGGGPGTTGFDAPLPEEVDDLTWHAEWEGTGQWQQTWNDSITIIESVAENLGIVGTLPSAVINGLAFRLMAEGGASAIDPAFARNWSTEAHQIIEEVLVGHLRAGTLGVEGDLGVGTITALENEIRAHAASQLITVTDEEVRAGAMDIKTEQGLNKDQVFATLDNRAYGAFGLTSDFIDGLGSNPLGGQTTISDIVSPLHDAATKVWEDTSFRKNDQWLMDNYQEVMEDGSKRFRTAQEMRNLARGNLDRFQHSKQYQDPLNNFIRGAAAMFRSDY